jgi:hypothetical protein
MAWGMGHEELTLWAGAVEGIAGVGFRVRYALTVATEVGGRTVAIWGTLAPRYWHNSFCKYKVVEALRTVGTVSSKMHRYQLSVTLPTIYSKCQVSICFKKYLADRTSISDRKWKFLTATDAAIWNGSTLRPTEKVMFQIRSGAGSSQWGSGSREPYQSGSMSGFVCP